MSTRAAILEIFAAAARRDEAPWIDGASVIERSGARAYTPRARAGDPLAELEQLTHDERQLGRFRGARVELARFVTASRHFPCQRCRPGVLGLCAAARRLWLSRPK